MFGREDRPWYPTARLFRQHTATELKHGVDSIFQHAEGQIAESSNQLG
jgi:hypothetical protein